MGKRQSKCHCLNAKHKIFLFKFKLNLWDKGLFNFMFDLEERDFV